MPAALVERAIEDVAKHGKALFKFISANDVGLTKSHQYGYYLPKAVWHLFSPHPPKKGANKEHLVKVTWDNGRQTDSCVHWYGDKSRAEYRLTRFGKSFPYLDHDCVGSLLVLVFKNLQEWHGYVFDLEEDIEAVQSALRLDIIRWGAFDVSAGPIFEESPGACLDRRFRLFTAAAKTFPKGDVFSAEARAALEECVKKFLSKPSDSQLVACMEAEYQLFQMVERKVCEPLVVRLFASIDDFLKTAQMILQRRKARAGRSLENHVETVLRQADIPFEMRQQVEKTKPDIIIPGKKQYLDPKFPDNKLFIIGVKTTCKDRWRQVTREGKRIKDKHILTTQAGISPNQLDEMAGDNVTLIVPKSLHKQYPDAYRKSLLTVEGFIQVVRKRLSA